MILKKHGQFLNFFRFVVDLIIVFALWILAYCLRFEAGIIELTRGDDTLSNYLSVVPVLLVSYALVFLSTGVYRRSLESRRIWQEHFDLARSHVLAFFVFVTSVYFIYEHRFSRVTLFLFFCMMPLALPMGRSIIRKFNRIYLRNLKTRRNAIVVGTGKLATRMAELIGERADWHLKHVATLPASEMPAIRTLLAKGEIATVFIAADPQEMMLIQEIYDGLGNTVAEVYLLPDLGIPSFLNPVMLHIENMPAIALNTSNLDGYGRFFKRVFDIAFSALFLICASPIYLVCALAVKLTSPGPVFYMQERMGLDGRIFNCIKFRGMYVNAEAGTGPVWAKPDDDRTTPVGKWLRRTSLDEIPQFLNVLMGQMSVVGPRPERPVFVTGFRDKIPGYMLRHKVKAGITGWAQINGWRGNTSLEKRIECDLWYIQNWSLTLDLKICLLTPFQGLVHPNAY